MRGRAAAGWCWSPVSPGWARPCWSRRSSSSWDGARWLWGACDGLLTPRPLGPLFDIGPQAGGELAVLCRQGAARDQLFTAFLAELAAPGPLTVVVIEDLHWADEATTDLLSYLGRRLAPGTGPGTGHLPGRGAGRGSSAADGARRPGHPAVHPADGDAAAVPGRGRRAGRGPRDGRGARRRRRRAAPDHRAATRSTSARSSKPAGPRSRPPSATRSPPASPGPPPARARWPRPPRSSAGGSSWPC